MGLYITDEQQRYLADQSWSAMYVKLIKRHVDMGWPLTALIPDRSVVTRSGIQAAAYEEALATMLAFALRVPRWEVGKRTITLGTNTKSFDVCWPMVGDPKILISVKTMHSSKKNLTNRREEANGDADALKAAYPNAVFGYFFAFLDSAVARGEVKRTPCPIITLNNTKLLRYDARLEEGGDCPLHFGPRLLPKPLPSGVLPLPDLQESMLTLKKRKYDALAFFPYQVTNFGTTLKPVWRYRLTEVADGLRFADFIPEIMGIAQERGLLPPGAPTWSITSVPFCLTKTALLPPVKVSPVSSTSRPTMLLNGSRVFTNAPWVYC